jgi:recombination protein RecR
VLIKAGTTKLFVVEDIRDVMAIENTGQFREFITCLGGKISPIDGVGPSPVKHYYFGRKVKSGNCKRNYFCFKFHNGR